MSSYTPPRVPSVDQVATDERAARFTKRSIKTTAKLAGLQMVASMIDLTTLEGNDTPGKVEQLCRKARRPMADDTIPPVAAVCVYPNHVVTAKRELEGTGINVAAVATYFPSKDTAIK